MSYNKEDNRPILVQFENGVLKGDMKSQMKFKYLRSKERTSNKRMLVAESDTLTYVGNILQKQQSLVKYYVGLVDKSTHKIEAVQGVQLCTLKPKLQTDENANAKEESKEEKTYREKSDMLVKAFGSAKQKRLLSSRKKNEGAQDSIDAKVVNVAKKISINSPSQPDLDESMESDTDVMPQRNLNALKTSEIFHVDDIITFSEYQFLKRHSDLIDFDDEALLKWKEEKRYSEFVLHQLSLLPLNSIEREERACYLCYLNYLIKFSKMTYGMLNRKDPCPEIPRELLTNILDKFTLHSNGKTRCIPRKYKDKIMCYILVLALIISDYSLSCNLLLKDLKVGIPKTTKLLRAIGCTVTVSNKKRKADEAGNTLPSDRELHAVLKLPKGAKKDSGSSEVKTEEIDNVLVKKENEE